MPKLLHWKTKKNHLVQNLVLIIFLKISYILSYNIFRWRRCKQSKTPEVTKTSIRWDFSSSWCKKFCNNYCLLFRGTLSRNTGWIKRINSTDLELRNKDLQFIISGVNAIVRLNSSITLGLSIKRLKDIKAGKKRQEF